MYCPRDGIELHRYGTRTTSGIDQYLPCRGCAVTWMRDGDRYHPLASDGELDETLDQALKEAGADHRRLGIDTLVADIVDAMEKQAAGEGRSTYYTGTYAVARDTIVHAGLTVCRGPQYHCSCRADLFGPAIRGSCRNEGSA